MHTFTPTLAHSSPQVKRIGIYEVGKTLGEGTFGKVKAAVNVETGQHVRAGEENWQCVSFWHPIDIGFSPTASPFPFYLQVAIKILEKDKIQTQNMGQQIKKEVRTTRYSLARTRVLSGLIWSKERHSRLYAPPPPTPWPTDLDYESCRTQQRC